MRLRRAAMVPALLALFAAAGPAWSHPHVWIEMRSDVMFDGNGLISAMKLSWTFDDAYAQMALDGMDTNGDGTYSEKELEPLTAENIDSLKDYEYFTSVRFNGEKQPVGPVTKAHQVYANDRLTLTLEVPLKTPLDPRQGDFVLKVYDPEFYIAFDYVKAAPVSVSGAMPKDCQLVLKPVPTDAEVEQTRAMLATKGKDWKPDTAEDFGAVFAQPLTIQCQA